MKGVAGPRVLRVLSGVELFALTKKTATVEKVVHWKYASAWTLAAPEEDWDQKKVTDIRTLKDHGQDSLLAHDARKHIDKIGFYTLAKQVVVAIIRRGADHSALPSKLDQVAKITSSSILIWDPGEVEHAKLALYPKSPQSRLC